jgi:hypothetical protein
LARSAWTLSCSPSTNSTPPPWWVVPRCVCSQTARCTSLTAAVGPPPPPPPPHTHKRGRARTRTRARTHTHTQSQTRCTLTHEEKERCVAFPPFAAHLSVLHGMLTPSNLRRCRSGIGQVSRGSTQIRPIRGLWRYVIPVRRDKTTRSIHCVHRSLCVQQSLHNYTSYTACVHARGQNRGHTAHRQKEEQAAPHAAPRRAYYN